jgi:RNA polymerase sigma-70 factor (ECF subfamily)
VVSFCSFSKFSIATRQAEPIVTNKYSVRPLNRFRLDNLCRLEQRRAFDTSFLGKWLNTFGRRSSLSDTAMTQRFEETETDPGVASRGTATGVPLPLTSQPTRVVWRGALCDPPPTGSGVGNAEFEHIVRDYSRYVAAIGHRLLDSRAEVDDLLQDVFFTAYQSLDTLRDRAAMKAWLATIATRLARRVRHHREPGAPCGLDTNSGCPPLPAVTATPEDCAEAARACQVLDALPGGERAIWELRYVEGWTLSEISQRRRCSVSTVQRRLRDADRKMRRRFGAE